MFLSVCFAMLKQNIETIKVDIRKPARNDQRKQCLHAMYALSSLVTNLNLKDILESMHGPFLAETTMKRFKREDHIKNHKCSVDSAQLPTMVDTNCIQAASNLQFQSIPDNAYVSNIISDTYSEFSDFVPELVPDFFFFLPDDCDDEDIDNAALAHYTFCSRCFYFD